MVVGEHGSSDGLAGAVVVPDRCGHGQQALQDADQDAAWGVSAVLFEIELAFEGVKDRLDALAQWFEEPAACSFGFALAGAAQQPDAGAGDAGLEVAVVVVLVRQQDLPWSGRGQGGVNCAHTGSGIQSCLADGETSDFKTLGEGANQSVTGTATDWAGNTATDTASGINIDKTAPSVSLVGGPSPSYYFGNDPAAPTCDASDALSGLASCVVSGGGTSVGQHAYTATATDNAGNIAAATLSYEVLAWDLKGFYAPVDMGGGVWNTVKGGSTVPLKFEVFAGSTELTSTSAIQSFKTTPVSCSSGTGEDAIDILSTGGTILRYDSTGGQFIQNWKTPTGAGSCYSATMTSLDGSFITALFKIK